MTRPLPRTLPSARPLAPPQELPRGRRFVAHVNAREALRFMGAGMALFCLAAVLSMIATGQVPLFTLAMGAALAFHFWPLLASRRPVLDMDVAGLELDGFGRIAWAEVRRIGTISLGDQERPLPLVRLALTRPLAEIQAGQRGVGGLRSLQAKLWRADGPDSLVVALGNLEDPPEAIKEAMTILSGMPVQHGRGLLA